MVTEEHAAGALDGSVDPEELTTLLAQENQDLRAEIERLQAENAELISALKSYEAAHDSLFTQCCSNPITNAWGKQVDVSLLNHAYQEAGIALDSAKRRRQQAMTKEQP